MDKKVTLCAVGDIGLHGDVGSLILEKGSEYPFDKVKELFGRHDLVFGNLEIPFSEHGRPFFEYETDNFHADIKTADALVAAGFNIMSLANNHILECGPDSLGLSIDVLDKNNILNFGAGTTIKQARKALVVEKNDLKIGFLGYSTKDKQSATDQSAGSSPIVEEFIREDIATLRPKVDVLIISLHFGLTYMDYPNDEGIALAHNVIDWGADLILGHHPHVVQGIENYNDKLIIYSLGEFLFDPTQGLRYSKVAREERKRSFVFSCTLGKNGVEDYTYFPTRIDESYQVYIMTGEEKESMKAHLRELSENIGKIDFYEYAGPQVVNNEMALLLLHLKKMNLKALFHLSKRIKMRHFLLLGGWLKKKVRRK